MTNFTKGDRVALNEDGVRAYTSGRRPDVDWTKRRGYVAKGNPRDGGEVLVEWNGLKKPIYVPSMYLRHHEIGCVPKGPFEAED